jgi:hypothetical protein
MFAQQIWSMDDPLAALMEEMACAQRGEVVDKSNAGKAGSSGGKASAGAQKASATARRRPEPEPTPEERSIWRPDVEVSPEVMLLTVSIHQSSPHFT